MRIARRVFPLTLCIVLLLPTVVKAQRKFKHCWTAEEAANQMNEVIIRLVNGDTTLDLDAFEEEVVLLFTFDESPLPWRIVQCIWLVAVNTIAPGRHNLRYYANLLAPHEYGDWGRVAYIMRLVAYDETSPSEAVRLLDVQLAKQLR